MSAPACTASTYSSSGKRCRPRDRLGCLWVTHSWLGSYWPVLTSRLADNISGNIIGIGLATLFRFWAYRRFVFRQARGLREHRSQD